MDKLAGDLMNDSDSEDQDYVPSGGEESGDEEDEAPANDEVPEEDDEEKKKTDALWADFLADVEPTAKKARVDNTTTTSTTTSTLKNTAAVTEKASKTTEGTAGASGDSASSQKTAGPDKGSSLDHKQASKNADSKSDDQKSNVGGSVDSKRNTGEDSAGTSDSGKIKVTQVFDFAGEKIEVEKELDKDSKEAKRILAEQSMQKEQKVLVRPNVGGGLSTVVGAVLSKKNKMSVLDKSKLDWTKFKRAEGIEEELANHNKDGYLERMAFLERTDLRQFNIEKALRDKQRSSRGGNM